MLDLRLLTGEDEARLNALVWRDPFYNLFMIGNLETLGLGHELLRFWGQFSAAGELLGVAMRYRVYWGFYAGAGGDPGAFARLVDEHPDSQAINGHPDQVGPVVERLRRLAVRELHASYYCRLPPETGLPAPAWPTRRATAADVEALVALYAEAGIMRQDTEGVRRSLNMGRIVVAEAEGRVVSSARTSTETSQAAMVGGVFTPEPWRGRGYATAAMTHLCAELLAEGKQPCLFYDNPAAGSIYRRLGFEDIGPWNLVLLEPCRDP